MNGIDKKTENRIEDRISERLRNELEENNYQFQPTNDEPTSENTHADPDYHFIHDDNPNPEEGMYDKFMQQQNTVTETLDKVKDKLASFDVDHHKEKVFNGFKKSLLPFAAAWGITKGLTSFAVKSIKRGHTKAKDVHGETNPILFWGIVDLLFNLFFTIFGLPSWGMRILDVCIFLALLYRVVGVNPLTTIFSGVIIFGGFLSTHINALVNFPTTMMSNFGITNLTNNVIGTAFFNFIGLAIGWAIFLILISYISRIIFQDHSLVFNRTIPLLFAFLWEYQAASIVIKIIEDGTKTELFSGSLLFVAIALLNGWFLLGYLTQMNKSSYGFKSIGRFQSLFRWVYIAVLASVLITGFWNSEFADTLFHTEDIYTEEAKSELFIQSVKTTWKQFKDAGLSIKETWNIKLDEWACESSKNGQTSSVFSLGKLSFLPDPKEACARIEERKKKQEELDPRHKKTKKDISTYLLSNSKPSIKLDSSDILIPFTLTIDNSKADEEKIMTCKCRFNIKTTSPDNEFSREGYINFESEEKIPINPREESSERKIYCSVPSEKTDDTKSFYEYFGSSKYTPIVEAEAYCTLSETSISRIKVPISQEDFDETTYNIKKHPGKSLSGNKVQSINKRTQSAMDLEVESLPIKGEEFPMTTKLINYKEGEITNLKSWNIFIPDHLSIESIFYEEDLTKELNIEYGIDQSYSHYKLNNDKLSGLNKETLSKQFNIDYPPMVKIKSTLFEDTNNIKEVYIFGSMSYDYKISKTQRIDIKTPWDKAHKEHYTDSNSQGTTTINLKNTKYYYPLALNNGDVKVRAFMIALSYKESTQAYKTKKCISPYYVRFPSTCYEGNKHPNIKEYHEGEPTRAAGRYQFLFTTWNEWSKEANKDPEDYSPLNQDQVLYYKLTNGYYDITKFLENNDLVSASKKLDKRWPSLPTSTSDQPRATLEEFKAYYNEALSVLTGSGSKLGDSKYFGCKNAECLAQVAKYYGTLYDDLPYIWGGESPYSYEDTIYDQSNNPTSIFKGVSVSKVQPPGNKKRSGKATLPGFDCSGFLWWIFIHSEIPEFTVRLSASDYKKTFEQKINHMTQKVCDGDCTKNKVLTLAQEGDIILFNQGPGSKVDHIGVYIGNNKMIEATGDTVNGKDGVSTREIPSKFYDNNRVDSVFRIIKFKE